MKVRSGRKRPWELGLSKNASEEALAAWNALSAKERLLISRNNPYRLLRDRALVRLSRLGLTFVVLEQISGVPHSSIWRVVKRSKKVGDEQR